MLYKQHKLTRGINAIKMQLKITKATTATKTTKTTITTR